MCAQGEFSAGDGGSAHTLRGGRRLARLGAVSGSSDAGPRTDQSSRAVNAVMSTAPSMCTSTSTMGSLVKYWTNPINALGELDDQQITHRPAHPVRRVGCGERDKQRGGQPDQQEDQIGVQLADLLGVEPRAAGLRVAAVRPAARDDGADQRARRR